MHQFGPKRQAETDYALFWNELIKNKNKVIVICEIAFVLFIYSGAKNTLDTKATKKKVCFSTQQK